MYRADVARIEELNRQLDELRDHAAQQSRRIEALAAEVRSYRAGDGHARRSATAGVVIGVAPFMVIAAGLVVCGRGAIAPDRDAPIYCESHVAAAGGEAWRRAAQPDPQLYARTVFDVPAFRTFGDAGDENGLAPIEPGFLTLVCNPYCDEVLDNGLSLGPSPIVHMAVTPGRHVLSLLRRGFGSKTVAISVGPGKVSATRVSMTDL